MIVCDNGVIRDATPDEIAAWENHPPIEPVLSDSERIDALETAIKEGLKLC